MCKHFEILLWRKHGYFEDRGSRLYLVPVRALIPLFHIKDRLMYTFIINTTLLTL